MDSDEDNSGEFEMDTSNDSGDDDSACAHKPPSFQTLTADEIVTLMNEEIEHVDLIVEMPVTTIRILLGHTKWDKQELLDRITNEASRDQFFTEAHVRNPFKEAPRSARRATRRKSTCSICFTEFTQKDIVDLGCGHGYCKDCWRQYLTVQIVDDGNAQSICCPAPKCGIIVDDVTVVSLVSDDSTKQKYQHLMTNSYVEYKDSLRWCPAPGCVYAIKASHLLDYQQNCKCKCGKSFCFSCGGEPHDPVPCNLIKKWSSDNDDLTIGYLTKYTKNCPKCKSNIEKNGGCQHMTCRKCHHDFCWFCFGNWKGHSNCNRYKDNSATQRKKKRYGIWEHYMERYSFHKDSLQNELGSAEARIETLMTELQSVGKTLYEVLFLSKFAEILWESRKQLMLSYIFAYFVADHNQKTIFENNQADLEKATGELSQYLTKEVPLIGAGEFMNDIRNKLSYCQRRHETMAGHIFEGSEKNWWTFIYL